MAVDVHLFGASSAAGTAFQQQLAREPGWGAMHHYGRRESGPTRLDLLQPGSADLVASAGPGLLVSFAPIWLLAPFLERWLARSRPDAPRLAGVLACSSSSALTKRFAANRFDQELARRLHLAEEQLLAACRQRHIPCCVLQPSLIYGRVGERGDRNLSRLLGLMRRLPLLPLPARAGLRQPIHASQLGAVALALGRALASGVPPLPPARIALGGDQELSYTAMLRALQQALPGHDPARRCMLLPVPNRLFALLAAPLLLGSPRAFEAVLRMSADLAGFTPCHRLLGAAPQPFPVLPLAG